MVVSLYSRNFDVRWALATEGAGHNLVLTKRRADLYLLSSVSRLVYVDPNACSCKEAKSASISKSRCFDCEACKRWAECKDLKNEGKGPDHWRGRASKATGQDIRDFAYENLEGEASGATEKK